MAGRTRTGMEPSRATLQATTRMGFATRRYTDTSMDDLTAQRRTHVVVSGGVAVGSFH